MYQKLLIDNQQVLKLLVFVFQLIKKVLLKSNKSLV